MRLRANSKLTITTDIPEKIHDYPIVPMLLLPLVENAFKHGVHATDKSEIHISLTQNETDLEFEVENTYFEKTNSSDEGGIGLTNTKRRLHLVYPNKHLINAGINEQRKIQCKTANNFRVMTILKCIAVDDEPLALKLVETFIEQTPFLELMCSCDNAVEAMTLIREKQPDLIFLRYQYAQFNGNGTGKTFTRTTRTITKNYFYDSLQSLCHRRI